MFRILFLLLVISTPCWGETIDDLVYRNGLYYQKFTDVPFTGEIDEGEFRGSLKNGKREGFWLGYWDNGQLLSKGSFKNDKEEGSWEYYWKNGQLLSKGDFRNGKEEGSWMGFSKNGTVDTEYTGTYKNGVKVSD